MIKIAPSILAANLASLRDDILDVERSGADLLHIDIMDGQFVPNISFGTNMVKTVRSCTTLPLDVHLMIKRPDQYITSFAEAGASHLTVHAEACPHLHRTLALIRAHNLKVGLALNPATPLDILEWIGMEIDLLVIMTVNPGFGGQKLIPAMLKKIAKAKEIIAKHNWQIAIIVDGGVNVRTAQEVAASGANILVAGEAIFAAPNRCEVIKKLRGHA